MRPAVLTSVPVSTVMFVIVDLPYQGVVHIANAGMREALADMLRD